MVELVGNLIGDQYLVQAQIGEGGMSVVYRAQHLPTKTIVAIKVLSDEVGADETNRKRFQREAQGLKALNHPSLVKIFDFGITPAGLPFIAMEYIQGESLRDVLNERTLLAPEHCVPIFMQICDVMGFSHKHGIIHRDLKPENIMLLGAPGGPEAPRIKILDFGILLFDTSVYKEASQRLTASGLICGSPLYMSPEQIKDEEIDLRTDIYGLGIMMYETLVGVPPFNSTNIGEVLFAQTKTQPQPLSQVRKQLNFYPSLGKIVLHALEKEKQRRYQSMEELKEDLAVFLARIADEIAASMGGPKLPPLPHAER